MSDWAPDWTDEKREAWKDAYRNDKPVEWPIAEHLGECEHCDTIMALIREVDAKIGKGAS